MSQNEHYTGLCTVCLRDNRRVIESTGLLHPHGSRDNPCTGSHTRPALGSMRAVSSRASLSTASQQTSSSSRQLVTNGPFTTTDFSGPTNTISVPSSPAPRPLNHPSTTVRILKRIPKAARHVLSFALQKVIKNCVSNAHSTEHWKKLLDFTSSCLAQPRRGGKSRNLATLVIHQVRAFDSFDTSSTQSENGGSNTNQHPSRRKALSSEQLIASRAAAKLEDGDVKGAVRVLSSNESLAPFNLDSYNALLPLHPNAPPDRRDVPLLNSPSLQVGPAAVRAAITSFPNGSAGGPDGMRPQHLKDLLTGAADDDPLLGVLTELTNLLLSGDIPSHIRGALFGANLLAIAKKGGGVRPIAVGYVWRRLAAKVACQHVKERSFALLAPRQLGFAVKGGAEAAAHATRRFLQNMQPGEVFVKIDFKNAFNTIRRDNILESVSQHFPELLDFASSSLSSPSDLQFGNHILHSAEGAQQGDPLGPLYFCLAIHDVLVACNSEMVVAYLDDVGLGGDAEVVARDFALLQEMSAQRGLILNRSKCEVIGHSTETRELFTSRNFIIPETDIHSTILLGAPLFQGAQLDNVLAAKREELQRLTERLALMPAHDALFLLRNVLSLPRLLYTLRTAPCTGSAELSLYDAHLRATLSTTLNVDLNDDRWTQASLPVRWGGIGIRGASTLAPSAYLASAASSTDLVQLLLPARLHSSTDPYIETSLTAWRTITGDVPPPSSSVQRTWDDVCCKTIADDLLSRAPTPTERARLLASRAEGSGDWLQAFPLPAIGLKLDNASVRIAVGLRLGAPLVHPHACVCGAQVEANGLHGLACRKSAGRHSRHNQINEQLLRGFVSAGIQATREPQGLCDLQTGKRPDGVTSVPWFRGRCLAWDATCPDTFAQSHVQASSVAPGSAAQDAETRKTTKYADICRGIDFVPVAIETSGVWGKEGWALVKELGRRISVVKKEARSTVWLRQRISLAIQRGNSFSVLATHSTAISDAIIA